MNNISVQKIVFLLMGLGAIVFTFMGILDPKDFMNLTLMAFGAYFATSSKNVNDFDEGTLAGSK